MDFNLRNKFGIGKLYNIWFLWAFCLLLNIITFFYIYFKISPGGKVLALHYNVLVGVVWYGKGVNLYFLPATGLAIALVNFWIFKALKNDKIFLSSLTAFTSACVQLILLVAVLFLARLS
jgi:hypothetical protein